MSLLEDVFLEDEAGEAQDLERVIDGDEYDERPRSLSPDSDENSEKEDEAEEDKRRVDPTQAKTKRVVKNPRFVLNPARLTGPRGIQVIPDHFKDFKFKGKGHEKEDLDLVLKKLEHWAYRLYPKFQFEDCLKKIETLGKKRPVMVHLHKIRSDQFLSEETVVQRDSSDDELPSAPQQEEDEFDKLLQQQIELARATPAPGSVRKPGFSTPNVDTRSPSLSTTMKMTKATSSPSISDEQRERMLKNRKLAEEKRLARLKQMSESNTQSNIINNSITNDVVTEIVDVEEISRRTDDITKLKRHNRSNRIDSSDDECELAVINKSITVDIHDTVTKDTHTVNDKIEMNCDKQDNNDDNMIQAEIEGNERIKGINSDGSNMEISDVQETIDTVKCNDIVQQNTDINHINDNEIDIVDRLQQNAEHSDDSENMIFQESQTSKNDRNIDVFNMNDKQKETIDLTKINNIERSAQEKSTEINDDIEMIVQESNLSSKNDSNDNEFDDNNDIQKETVDIVEINNVETQHSDMILQESNLISNENIVNKNNIKNNHISDTQIEIFDATEVNNVETQNLIPDNNSVESNNVMIVYESEIINKVNADKIRAAQQVNTNFRSDENVDNLFEDDDAFNEIMEDVDILEKTE